MDTPRLALRHSRFQPVRRAAVALLAAGALACGSVTTPPAPAAAPTIDARAAGSVVWDIANLPHERVDYWVEQFSRGEKRDEFAGYLARKPQYEAMILEQLERRRLPRDLIYLAMIESGFNPEAHSAYAARGIWQLIPDTARRYGLRVDEQVDERLDPEKSTEAAIHYLTDLYQRFGSWYLAVAAYNAGENRVARIMTEATGSERGSDEDYYRIWQLLPAETRDFVPVMIAAARIGKEPGRYGF